MGFYDEVRAVPKPKKKEKEKPKFYNKRPNKKPKKKPKKKSELKAERKGLKPPSVSKRNSFSDKEYNEAITQFGKVCADPTCQMAASEMHHIVFRSQSGRGKWRNAVPLCVSHHTLCHRSRRYSDMWKQDRTLKYGEFFYMDEWDLWMKGLIENPTKEEFEEYMKGAENSERKSGEALKKIHRHQE